jgi:hypothetical protein
MVPPVPITATLGREDVMSLPSVWIENSEGVAQSFQFTGLWKLDAMFLQLTICSASGRPLEEQPAKHVLRAELQTAPKGVGATLLVSKPTLFGKRPAHSAVGFSLPRPETGLRQILTHSLPMGRLSAGRVDLHQYEGADVIECPKHTFASWSARIHLDRPETKLAHGMQTPASVGEKCLALKSLRLKIEFGA